jgi:hypothetical protein
MLQRQLAPLVVVVVLLLLLLLQTTVRTMTGRGARKKPLPSQVLSIGWVW